MRMNERQERAREAGEKLTIFYTLTYSNCRCKDVSERLYAYNYICTLTTISLCVVTDKRDKRESRCLQKDVSERLYAYKREVAWYFYWTSQVKLCREAAEKLTIFYTLTYSNCRCKDVSERLYAYNYICTLTTISLCVVTDKRDKRESRCLQKDVSERLYAYKREVAWYFYWTSQVKLCREAAEKLTIFYTLTYIFYTLTYP